MPKLNVEAGIPGYKGGFKEGDNKGEIDRREYSVFLEQAEKLLKKIRKLEKEIQKRMKQELSGREEEDTNTFNEMLDELRSSRDLLSNWRTSDERKEQLLSFIERLERDIESIGQELDLPKLAQEIHQLGNKVKALLEKDKLAELALKNMPPEEMADYNV